MSSAAQKCVVVTGANEGIGYRMAAALLEDGYRVAGLDVNGEQIESLRETYPNRVRFHRCDVAADDDVRAAIDAVLDRWDRIDVLVNNAAIFTFAPSRTRPSPTRAASSKRTTSATFG